MHILLSQKKGHTSFDKEKIVIYCSLSLCLFATYLKNDFDETIKSYVAFPDCRKKFKMDQKFKTDTLILIELLFQGDKKI